MTTLGRARKMFTLALVTGLLLAATSVPASAQARGGTLKVSYPEPTHLNPAIVSGTPTGIPGVQIFAGLVLHDDKFQPQPYLAERWTISPDARTYTFYLRNATFHDGRPITRSARPCTDRSRRWRHRTPRPWCSASPIPTRRS